MEIKVLGPGCPKCKKLFSETVDAVASSGVSADLRKVEAIEEIIQYGVMMTPALVIDGEVKACGRVPERDEIAAWIAAAAKSSG